MSSGSFVEYIYTYLDIGDIIVIIFAVVILDQINFRPGPINFVRGTGSVRDLAK